ncbi:MAG TPA: response regulator [Rhizomicrobium sp.]|nr:response regulator [Rhizomicrobium sp.]
MKKASLNLKGAATLIVDDDKFAVGILLQMLRGFGIDQPVVVESGAAAKKLLANHVYDLCILEARLPDMKGSELLHWIRRQKPPVRFMPSIVVTGYSQLSNIVAMRDSGAHTVIKKPLSPQALFDRIGWAADGARAFVEVGGYIGPDRRFKFVGPPDGVGRRQDDLSGEIGEATEPNMSQAEIDAMIRPTKIMAE